jgi:preprotein translocase subunit Sss1
MDNGRRDVEAGMNLKQFCIGVLIYGAIGLAIYLINFKEFV